MITHLEKRWTRLIGWLTVMSKVIEWCPKPEKLLRWKFPLVLNGEQSRRDDIGNQLSEWLKRLIRWKYAWRWTKEGAQSELKSTEGFASLLSTDRVRVLESGTKDCRFTLATLVRESETFYFLIVIRDHSLSSKLNWAIGLR